jgi:hypothetical protein
MFDQALQQLIWETGADLAVFCDFEGESIAFASNGIEDYDVRVIGAQLGSVVVGLQSALVRNGVSDRAGLSLVSESCVILIEALPGNYYLVVRLRPYSLWSYARQRLQEVATRFFAEIQ